MDRIDSHVGTIQNAESDSDNLSVTIGNGSGKSVFWNCMIHRRYNLTMDGTGCTFLRQTTTESTGH